MNITCPLLALPGFVLMPACTATLFLGPDSLQRQLALSESWSRLICVLEAGHYQKGRDLVGCLARVGNVHKAPTGWTVQLAGLRRLRIEAEIKTDQGLLVGGQETPSQPWREEDTLPEFDGLCEVVQHFRGRIDGGLWLDMAAFHLPLEANVRQKVLCQIDPYERAQTLRRAQTPSEALPGICLN